MKYKLAGFSIESEFTLNVRLSAGERPTSLAYVMDQLIEFSDSWGIYLGDWGVTGMVSDTVVGLEFKFDEQAKAVSFASNLRERSLEWGWDMQAPW